MNGMRSGLEMAGSTGGGGPPERVGIHVALNRVLARDQARRVLRTQMLEAHVNKQNG